MKQATIIIRADGSESIGLGHVIRCSSLAICLKESGIIPHFAIRQSAQVEKLLKRNSLDYSILSAGSTIKEEICELGMLIEYQRAEAVVLDHYNLGPEYQRAVKEMARLLVCIDDYYLPLPYADIVLNQNYHAGVEGYRGKVSPDAKLLLGPKYALLRPQFSAAGRRVREINKTIRRLLISFGGADSANLTAHSLNAIESYQRLLKVDVVLGAAFRFDEEINELARISRHFIKIHKNINYIHDLMLEADIIICSGGSTCWEVQNMGLPAIIINQADNQRMIAESLAEYGSAIYLGFNNEVSVRQIADALGQLDNDWKGRNQMSRLASKLVDGKGTMRTATILVEAINSLPDLPKS